MTALTFDPCWFCHVTLTIYTRYYIISNTLSQPHPPVCSLCLTLPLGTGLPFRAQSLKMNHMATAKLWFGFFSFCFVVCFHCWGSNQSLVHVRQVLCHQTASQPYSWVLWHQGHSAFFINAFLLWDSRKFSSKSVLICKALHMCIWSW